MVERYDLHTHFFTNWDRGKFSLERKPRTIESILNAMKRKGLDGIGFANFGNDAAWKDAYEQLVDLARWRKGLGEYKVVKFLDNAMIFADKKGLLKIIKVEEISARERDKETHIMAIGLGYGKIIPNKIDLENALKEIKNIGVISNADHYNGWRGIGRNNIIKYTEKGFLDTWERFNANLTSFLLKPFVGINPSEQEADELEKETGTYGISVSDCHNYQDVGNGYIEVEGGFDFSRGDNLRESIKDVLKNGKFKAVAVRGIPVSSVVGHILVNVYDTKIRNKFGWTKLDET